MPSSSLLLTASADHHSLLAGEGPLSAAVATAYEAGCNAIGLDRSGVGSLHRPRIDERAVI
jgi:hypothetical protein